MTAGRKVRERIKRFAQDGDYAKVRLCSIVGIKNEIVGKDILGADFRQKSFVVYLQLMKGVEILIKSWTYPVRSHPRE